MKNKIYLLLSATLALICALFCLFSCDAFLSEDATVGIASSEINENGELVFTYTDGTVENLGVVVGKDGKDGKDGTDGKNGTDGKDGKDGIDGADGVDGADGKDGKDGAVLDDGTVVIQSGDISQASAKGLRSAVSISCKFTVTQNSYFGGSYTTTATSAGSGVIYQMNKSEGDAFIITNYHVVYYSGANTSNDISDNISVYLYGMEYGDYAIPATYVGGSMCYDIAVLRVENSEILKNSVAKAVDISSSQDVFVGDGAIAIGNAQGLGISSTSGVVSVDSEYITMAAADGRTEVSFRVMRIDTAINSGNSGGGLYNDEGELIGIVNAKITHSSVENIGYAIPVDLAISVANNVIDNCFGKSNERVLKGYVGLTVGITESRAIYDSESEAVRIEETVYVHSVESSSAADGIILEGDVISSVSLNGEALKIVRRYQAFDIMIDVRVGDTVTFELIRDGETVTVDIVITEDCLVSADMN